MWTDVTHLTSSDENVKKFIFKKDSAIAESVLYKYPTYRERTVMCISVMSGCPVGCTFCGTGKFYGRNLTELEIITQVREMFDMIEQEEPDLKIEEIERFQIMFMSMGEPLLNIHNLQRAIRILSDMTDGKASLLISTIGPTSGWDTLNAISKEFPQVGLQFSVHESTDEARNKLIPFKAKMTLEMIANQGVAWHNLTGRRPFFNYCVHEGNCTDEDVERLHALFNPAIWECTLSVVCEADEKMSDAVQHNLDRINDFSGRMVAKGYNTRVFNPAGQDDIGGGCGQLWQVQKFAEENPRWMRPSAGSIQAERNGNSVS